MRSTSWSLICLQRFHFILLQMIVSTRDWLTIFCSFLCVSFFKLSLKRLDKIPLHLAILQMLKRLFINSIIIVAVRIFLRLLFVHFYFLLSLVSIRKRTLIFLIQIFFLFSIRLQFAQEITNFLCFTISWAHPSLYKAIELINYSLSLKL